MSSKIPHFKVKEEQIVRGKNGRRDKKRKGEILESGSRSKKEEVILGPIEKTLIEKVM